MAFFPHDMGLYWPELYAGTAVTLALTACTLCGSACLSTLLAYALFLGNPGLLGVIRIGLSAVRGTPVLVQLYLVYYTLAGLGLASPFGCALCALWINSAAYTSTMLYQVIRQLPEGAKEAALLLGLSQRQVFAHILLPWAVRRLLGSFRNEVSIVLKSTALASTITLLDLMGVVQQLASVTYESLEWLHVAAIIYLTIAGVCYALFYWLERRYAL